MTYNAEIQQIKYPRWLNLQKNPHSTESLYEKWAYLRNLIILSRYAIDETTNGREYSLPTTNKIDLIIQRSLILLLSIIDNSMTKSVAIITAKQQQTKCLNVQE